MRTLISIALVTLTTIATAQQPPEQRFYQDTFDLDPGTSSLSKFWTPYGRDVRLDSRPGWVSIQENVTDVYTRIESGTFSPAALIRVRLKHAMFPSPSVPNFFFPILDFHQVDGQAVSFRWLRSQYGPDYCNKPNGYDKVLVRYSDPSVTPCDVSNIQSSTLFGRDIESTVEIDIVAGKLRYFIGPYVVGSNVAPDFESDLPVLNKKPIKKIVLYGYGWFTGHRHEIDKIDVSITPASTLPFPPLRATDEGNLPDGSPGRPWLPTLAEYYNFAGKDNYWAIQLDTEPYRTNHTGSDIANSRDGRLRVGSHMIGQTAYAICDGTVKVNNARDPFSPGSSFLKVLHENCAGRSFNAYYGHITSQVAVGTQFKAGTAIGKIADWKANSHLHITIDQILTRDLSGVKLIDCAYSADANNQVTNLRDCVIKRALFKDQDYTDADVAQVLPGHMLLRRGFGNLNVRAYRDYNSNAFHVRANPNAALYITDQAARCQRFIPLTDLWDSTGLPNLVCQNPGD